MIEQFQSIISTLTQPGEGENTFSILDARETFHKDPNDDAGVVRALTLPSLSSSQGPRTLYQNAQGVFLPTWPIQTRGQQLPNFTLTD